ncbi:MAG TPA: hypothetical protein VF070_31265 [Streptosporangiaceae bacterium]
MVIPTVEDPDAEDDPVGAADELVPDVLPLPVVGVVVDDELHAATKSPAAAMPASPICLICM